MKTYAYGFPRLGKTRQYKQILESFFTKKCAGSDVFQTLSTIAEDTKKTYATHVDTAPDGEMSLYDPMLDTAILCGLYNPQNLDDYVGLCRGKEALTMTKWFNTNYHYLVPDFSTTAPADLYCNSDNVALSFKKQASHPQFIGPFTLLKLAKGVSDSQFRDYFLALIAIYKTLLAGYKTVQLDEPAFVMELSATEIAYIKEGYAQLGAGECAITLMTYYDNVDFLPDLSALPVAAIGLDFVRGKDNLATIVQHGFPADKTLIAGLVDGRNIWKNNIGQSVDILKTLTQNVNDLAVSNAGPLYHAPISLTGEEKMAPELYACLAFATEKLAEVAQIGACVEGAAIPPLPELGGYGKKTAVQERCAALSEKDFVKNASREERRDTQHKRNPLPLFPTTTIGSFPQTPEVRKQRATFRKGELPETAYTDYIHGEIDKSIQLQENIGLDVLVHGEFERTDMVEFFAQKLDGIATTQAGWIISYGTRVYRPPVVFGDISRPAPMTVDTIAYAQSRTKKPVKGMLTGAVTIIAWSFVREDISLSDVAYQISLSLQDEIRDYEKAGIGIVQVDEAAFREKAPIKKRDWSAYFDWAVKSFNLATHTDPATQIHTHMCYSEFGAILPAIQAMDFDVISIESARSKGDILNAFGNEPFKRDIGLGVWDIHSPVIPSEADMRDVVDKSLTYIPSEHVWLNPDCGLKTRQWPETEKALRNLVNVAHHLRPADNSTS